ncbi:hypothetical protein KL919_003967 [Ogataea angusta]|nr:hypothetical protein KL919_003967 [Ogataea angusta]
MSKPSTSPKDVVKYLKRRSGDLLHLHSDSGMKPAEEHADAKSGPCTRLSFDVGVCENRNSRYRPSMEDVHTYVANFAERLDWGYFAVFDGHAGKNAARWCGSNLHNILVEKIMDDDNVDLRENLNNSFLEADVQMEREIQGSSGCTAAVAVLRWEEEIDDSESEDEIDPKTTPRAALVRPQVFRQAGAAADREQRRNNAQEPRERRFGGDALARRRLHEKPRDRGALHDMHGADRPRRLLNTGLRRIVGRLLGPGRRGPDQGRDGPVQGKRHAVQACHQQDEHRQRDGHGGAVRHQGVCLYGAAPPHSRVIFAVARA